MFTHLKLWMHHALATLSIASTFSCILVCSASSATLSSSELLSFLHLAAKNNTATQAPLSVQKSTELAAARQSDDTAFNLASKYYRGDRVERDTEWALRLLESAVEHNSPRALLLAALIWELGWEPSRGVLQDLQKEFDRLQLLMNSIPDNYPELMAQSNKIRSRMLKKKDIKRAAQLYQLGLMKYRDPYYELRLGSLLLTGRDDNFEPLGNLKPEPEEGFKFVSKAATAGLAQAKLLQAVALERGIGVARDHEKAASIYRSIDHKGELRAAISLRRLEYVGLSNAESKRISDLANSEVEHELTPGRRYVRQFSKSSLTYRAQKSHIVSLRSASYERLFHAMLQADDIVKLNPDWTEVIEITPIDDVKDDSVKELGILTQGDHSIPIRDERPDHNRYGSFVVNPALRMAGVIPQVKEPLRSDWSIEVLQGGEGLTVAYTPDFKIGVTTTGNFYDNGSNSWRGLALPDKPIVHVRIPGPADFKVMRQSGTVLASKVPAGLILILVINTNQIPQRFVTIPISTDRSKIPSENDTIGDAFGAPFIMSGSSPVGFLSSSYDSVPDGVSAGFVGINWGIAKMMALLAQDRGAVFRLASSNIVRVSMESGQLDPQVAADFIDSGSALSDLGRHDEATKRIEQGLEILRLVEGPNSIEYGNGLLALYLHYYNLGDMSQANVSLDRALAVTASIDPIRLQRFTKNNIQINGDRSRYVVEELPHRLINYRVKALQQQGRYEAAKSLLYELTARNILADPFNIQNLDVPNILLLAELELQSGNLEESRNLASFIHRAAKREAFVRDFSEPLPKPFPLPQFKGPWGDWGRNPMLAATIEDLGRVYWLKGRFAEAANAFQRAVGIRNSSLPGHNGSALRPGAFWAFSTALAGHPIAAFENLSKVTGWSPLKQGSRVFTRDIDEDVQQLIYDSWLTLVRTPDVQIKFGTDTIDREIRSIFSAFEDTELSSSMLAALQEDDSGNVVVNRQLLGEWRKTRSQLLSTRRSLESAVAKNRADREGLLREDELRQQIDSLTVQFNVLDQAVTSSLLGNQKQTAEALTDLAKSLEGDTVVVVIVPLRYTINFLVVRRNSVRHRFAPVANVELRGLIDEYRKELLTPHYLPALRANTLNLLPFRKLSDALLVPIKDLVEGASRIVVVPHGPLRSVPLEALILNTVSEQKLNVSDLSSLHFMGLEKEISYSPSIRALLKIRSTNAGVGSRADLYAGIGDPILGKADTRQWISDAAFDYLGVRGTDTMSTLPETAVEVEKLRELFGGRDEWVFLRSRATKKNLMSSGALDKAKIIHFATHGFTAYEDDSGVGQPFLLLSTPPGVEAGTTEERLTASEIMNLGLSADLVILSACSTAAPDGTIGSLGLSGLGQAFLTAGAKSLIVSHWQVNSRATYYFTTDFAEIFVQKGMPAGRALLLARQKLFHDRDWKHPYYWSAFVYVGNGDMKLNIEARNPDD